MRQSKFRSWDRHLKRMMDIQNLKDMLKHLNHNIDNIFMEWTGLKDKNRVEIYEGDIVKGSAYEQKIYTGVVSFYDASFVMRINGDRGYYRLNKMTFQELEVIGNIYENNELLEN